MKANREPWIGHRAFGNWSSFPRRSDGSVGLSMVEGREIASPDDLPEHLVTAYVFQDADQAATFVLGLQTAGLGNTMECCWEPHTTESNLIVFVAKFDEPRPAGTTLSEALPTVVHKPTGYDGKAMGRYMDRLQEERRQDAERQAAERVPYVEAVKSAGGVLHDYGDRWFRFSMPTGSFRDTTLQVEWSRDGSILLTCGLHEALEGNIDIADRVRAIVEGHGYEFEASDRDMRADGLTLDELGTTAAAMFEIRKECVAAKKAAWEESFRASMKMTGPRKRFLTAGTKTGIQGYNRRNNDRARAGSDDIGATEINALVRMGWIARGGPTGYVVTDEGRAAIGIEAQSSATP